MQIQWFPGHMNKARNEMRDSLPRVDLLIEVLDARIPYSSENPLLREIRGEKPCLKVLNKCDLADSKMTEHWLRYLENQRQVKARAITTKEPGSVRKLKSVCNQMVSHKGAGKSITAMIVGIPNVGKSTLINILAGKKVAKTGNEPAVTRGQQKINIGDGIYLLDTPGMLWPNVENAKSGYRLAATGAVKETAMEYEDVAFHTAPFLLTNYRDRIVERYQLDSTPQEPIQMLDMIAAKRGCLRKNGVIDYERASKIFITELRAGMLGPITLESPSMMELELEETALLSAQKAAKKEKKPDRTQSAIQSSAKRKTASTVVCWRMLAGGHPDRY